MRALVVAPQPFFTPRGTPFSVYYRTLVMAQLGTKIDLLTYGEGQDIDVGGVRIIRIPHVSALGNVKTGPSWKKLFLDGIMILWTIGLLIRNRYQFVHAHEEAVFFCRFLKPVFRFKLVYDMHSSLPQQLDNFNFTRSKLVRVIFQKLENVSIRAADAVITICPALAEYVETIIGKSEKHILIENSLFENVRLVPISNATQQQTDFEQTDTFLEQKQLLIVYSGTFEPYQGLEVLIPAFPTVLAHDANAFFVLVGGAPEQIEFYSNMAEQLGVSKQCLFTGRVPPVIARKYNRAASVLVSPRIAGTNTPLKIYEILASEIPLVATNIYSHTQVLTEDVAFLVEPNPDDMAQGILDALSKKEQAKAKAQNALALYNEKYSRPVYESKMRQLLGLLA